MGSPVRELESALAPAIESFIGHGCRIALTILEASGRAAQRGAGQELLERLAVGIPGAATSLSHTENLVIAIAADLPPGEGIGIDVERSAREVSPRLFRRFRSPGEDALPIRPIALWCAKEACFKANPSNAGTVIGQYRATAYLPGLQEGEPGEGFAQLDQPGASSRFFRFLILEHEGWVMAVANTVRRALS